MQGLVVWGVRPVRELITDIKADFLQLKADFPGTLRLWSDIFARTVWRRARLVTSIQKTRICINKMVGRLWLIMEV